MKLPLRLIFVLATAGMLLPMSTWSSPLIKPTTWCDHALSLIREKRDSSLRNLECQSNVWSLLGMFQNQNSTCSAETARALPPRIPIDRARVLFIFPKERGVRLRAFDTLSAATAWRYHIVIDIEGTIIDLDMNDHGYLMEPGLYFRSMFEPKNETLKAMWRSLGLLSSDNPLDAYVIKSFDAEDFANSFDKIIDGYKRTSSFYFNRAKEMKGEVARDYFRLNGIHSVETPASAIDPELPGKITFEPNVDADDLLDIEWKYEGTKFVLRMSDGEISLYRGKTKVWDETKTRSWYEDKAVHDPAAVDLFIQKLYFEAKKNSRLRQVLDEGIEYRRAFD